MLKRKVRSKAGFHKEVGKPTDFGDLSVFCIQLTEIYKPFNYQIINYAFISSIDSIHISSHISEIMGLA